MQKNNITTDDAGNLKIVISGSGNIQMINAPKINWPSGIDGYDAKIADGIDKSSVPMKGTKTFTYPFTVSKAGTYTIPSISFSYFDPANASYKTLLTEPLLLAVTKGKGLPNNSYTNNTSTKNDYTNILNTYGLYLIAGIVFIAGIIFWGFSKKGNRKIEPIIQKELSENSETKKETKEKEFLIPGNPLEGAYDQLMKGNSSTFYSVLDASLKKYLAAKFKVPVEELNKKRINEEMDNSNVNLGTSLRLSALLEEIELNVYAPPSHTNHLKEVYGRAAEIISLLDKQVINYQ